MFSLKISTKLYYLSFFLILPIIMGLGIGLFELDTVHDSLNSMYNDREA